MIRLRPVAAIRALLKELAMAELTRSAGPVGIARKMLRSDSQQTLPAAARRFSTFSANVAPCPSGGHVVCPLSRAKKYIEDNLAGNLRVAEIAQFSELSQSYFPRAFKMCTGMPPHRWILQARRRRVQVLLLEGRYPIVFIAIEVGFSDQSHFTRIFKRLTGYTPVRWQDTRRPTVCSDIQP
jgi:AraC-like DNA-binding protein